MKRLCRGPFVICHHPMVIPSLAFTPAPQQPVPRISVVPAAASRPPAETLPAGRDRTGQGSSHVCRVPPALLSPLETILHFTRALSYCASRKLTLPSLLAPRRTPLAALSLVLSRRAHGTSSEAQAQQSLRTARFLPPTKTVSGSSAPALPFLLPAGERVGTTSIGAPLAKDAAAC